MEELKSESRAYPPFFIIPTNTEQKISELSFLFNPPNTLFLITHLCSFWSLMGSLSLLTSTLLILHASVLITPISAADQSQTIRSGRHLDLLIKNYTFQSCNNVHFKTGTTHAVNLPANLSGIRVDAVKFRCGSLRRYGGRVEEFRLSVGVIIDPCVERVMLVRQNLGDNWSSLFFSYFELSGYYKLVSPVLGLLAYNADTDANFTDAFGLGIADGDEPITVDFRNVTKIEALLGKAPICAGFGGDGKVTLTNQVKPLVCAATKQGHFGLVIESPPPDVEPPSQSPNKKISRWKVAVGSSIGAVVGAVLLALLLVAMVIKEKKKSRMEELERKAYEEEALQVSMVGHVRAPIAAATRTTPTIEYEYRPLPL